MSFGWRSRRQQLRALQSSDQERLVDELRADIARLPQRGHEEAVSPWWEEVRTQLVDHIERDDPRSFLHWEPIRQTMFISPDEEFVATELAELQASGDWQERWSHALLESPAGCPAPYRGFKASSGTLIHHAYHLLILERTIGRRIENLREMVEFGGGYGSFARLVYGLGFDGRYHVYDFPELNALQRYYVNSVAAADGGAAFPDTFVSTSDRLALPTVHADDSLFVALWSLSETPLHERELWIGRIAAAGHVLIAYQAEFEDVGNDAWFGALQTRVRSHAWSRLAISHLPGHAYLIGRRLSQPAPHT